MGFCVIARFWQDRDLNSSGKINSFCLDFLANPLKFIMADPYYAPGKHRAAKVDQLFTAVAKHYDLINDIQSFGLHRSWKQRVIQVARVQPGDHTLDICSGTGDLAI